MSTKPETNFKCLICSTILMKVFKVKWQFDPFECVKMVINKYNTCIHILFAEVLKGQSILSQHNLGFIETETKIVFLYLPTELNALQF